MNIIQIQLVRLLAIAAFTILLTLQIKDAGAFCVQTGYGLTSGEMTDSTLDYLLEELRTNTKKHGNNIQLFIVQKKGSHYGKVCNEASQKEHFRREYITTNGQWQCNDVCGDDKLVNMYNKPDSIIRIELKGDSKQNNVCYKACIWREKKSNPAQKASKSK